MIEDNFNDMPEMNNDELIPISGMYKDWFIDYASYVILERAVARFWRASQIMGTRRF